MPKIRGIKPDLWTDENFVELSPFARLLWIGLWNFACDNGHLQDKSKQIKMRVLPTDDVNCAELLREIEAQGLIHRSGGWITIPNLSHHQKPHKSQPVENETNEIDPALAQDRHSEMHALLPRIPPGIP